MFIIEHDNGKRGQVGYSEYQVISWEEISQTVTELEKEGIIVYSIHKIN